MANFWTEALARINAEKDPAALRDMQFEPGPIDMALGRGSGLTPIGLEEYRNNRLKELEKRQALPVEGALSGFSNQGWSSDPSFSGEEWTKGLLDMEGIKPDMSNPNILKAVTDFSSQAQKEKSYADQLMRMGRPVEEAGSLSRFALDPGITPHLKTLEAAPDVFSVPGIDPKEAQSNRDKQFMENAYSPFVTDAKTQEEAMNLIGDIATELKPSPAIMEKTTNDILGKLFTTKKDQTDKINDYNVFYRGFAAQHPELKGGELDAAATKEWHKMKVAEGQAIGGSRVLPFQVIPGAFTSEGTPVVLNKKGGIVTAANNPQSLDVGGGKADQKNFENLKKITGVLKSNEIEANKNFDQLTGLYRNMGNGSIPVLNNVINRLKNNLGAPEPGTAEGVAYEALTQYARVVNKQTTGGAVTDTARKEAVALLNVMKLNPKQFEAKVKQYRITMKNAMDSQNEAIKQARGGGAEAKKLDAGTARQFLQRAGGDKEKARQMARKEGYEF